MELRGIVQSDILLRGAILAGLEDLRANPWVLDHAMADLVQDELTKERYGEKEVQRLREWFLGLYEGAGTGITVFDGPGIETPSWPCVTIEVQDSNESENTLADQDADLSELEVGVTPALAGPLLPVSYAPLTGRLVLPADVTLPVIAGTMAVYDATGQAYPILAVVPGDQLVLSLPPGSAPALPVTVRAGSSVRVSMERAAFEETYRIGCHAASARAHLIYLHTVVLLILLRGRQALLEARGIERTHVRSGGMMRMEAGEQSMPVWSRYVTMTGVVRPVWPKARGGALWGVSVQPTVSDLVAPDRDGVGPSGGAVAPDEEAWLVEPLR